MPKNKPQQKLVSFTDNQVELDKISEDIKNGWSIISLVKNGNYYVGIMELNSNFSEAKETVFIPPRKRIKISR
ncbi:DUF2674 domain-containing protein [Candidatus Megaera venefica]|uniref:DUF2674 domain-containing protein n=1 Tax=Candidatus Megaera venefica TaxID=2055910 RepID=A0ABU5NB81_9RICK|nr:hypothetical protein [Candidatus Megaera venefica]MBY0533592.1 DUF2674 domain-containing protein [Rickettsiaceae bacterium]MEA0970420.1 DUF2674 domain-containing protein [Candidatus Megaera venefica]